MKKKEDDIHQYEVKYNVLDKIRPLIDQAIVIEKQIHKKEANQKEANWTLTMAKEADLILDEDLQFEVHQ